MKALQACKYHTQWAQVLVYGGTARVSLWDQAGFRPLYQVQKVFLLVFWGVSIYSTTMVFDTRWFDPDVVAVLL